MNPKTSQSSTGCPLNGNAIHCPRSPPLRSFELPSRGIRLSEPLYGLLRAYLGPNHLYRENRLRGHFGPFKGYVKPLCPKRRQPEANQGRFAGGRQLARSRIHGTSAKRQDGGALLRVTGARSMFRASLGGIRGFSTDSSAAQRSGLIGFLTSSSAAQRSGQTGSLTPSSVAQRSGQTGSLTPSSVAQRSGLIGSLTFSNAAQRSGQTGFSTDLRAGSQEVNTFFSFRRGRKKKGRKGVDLETYTLLDYIALTFLLSKNVDKGHLITHEILAAHDN